MSSPVRVLLFDHTASLGGGEIALLNLVKHLDPKIVHPVVLLAQDGPLAERLRPDIETHVLPLASDVTATRKEELGAFVLFRFGAIRQIVAYVRRLVRFIKIHEIDIVHTNSLKADIIGGIAGRLAGRKVLWHVRDRISSDYLPVRAAQVFRLLARIVPNYVVANSRATLLTLGQYPENIHAQSPLGSRVAVVHDGTTVAAMPPKLGKQSNGCFTIGLIGRISPWKGQDVFLRAAALLTPDFPSARFKIVGAALFQEHDFDRYVRQLAIELQLEDVVEFTGFRPDISDAIQELDLVVHASTIGEPFGQVIIEGMAAGKPVVATRGGGVPEIVVEKETGLLVPMGDVNALASAMRWMLSHPDDAAGIGQRGFIRVQKCFSIQATARRVETVYSKIMNRAGA